MCESSYKKNMFLPSDKVSDGRLSSLTIRRLTSHPKADERTRTRARSWVARFPSTDIIVYWSWFANKHLFHIHLCLCSFAFFFSSWYFTHPVIEIVQLDLHVVLFWPTTDYSRLVNEIFPTKNTRNGSTANTTTRIVVITTQFLSSCLVCVFLVLEKTYHSWQTLKHKYKIGLGKQGVLCVQVGHVSFWARSVWRELFSNVTGILFKKRRWKEFSISVHKDKLYKNCIRIQLVDKCANCWTEQIIQSANLQAATKARKNKQIGGREDRDACTDR